MKPLGTVRDFGAVDADNDLLLFESFEDHEAYQDARQRNRFLIVGRKGSGKTAIFKKLLDAKSFDYFCFGHTFSDYPWQYHDKQARIGIPDFDKYTHSWKYLILLTLAKIILNQDQSLPFEKSLDVMAKVERFVVDTYGSRDPDVTQIFTPSKFLKIKPHLDVDFGLLKGGISPESVPMAELPTVVQDVNRNLVEYCMDCLNPEHEYFICFDQLDLGFDPSKSEYASRLIGLLLACRDLNLIARAQEKKFFVVVFLRDDIYESLQFEDKNKLTENFLSLIEWDTPRTQRTLRDLMERRFTVQLRESPSEKIGWDDVFNETAEMPGHQKKYRHIIDRTFFRPRDVIRFCNTILGEFRASNSPGTDSKFENVHIHDARPDYSDYLLRELDDEVHKHIPDYKVHLELLKEMGKWQFSLEEFEDVCKTEKFAAEVSEPPAVILNGLFDFSVIGFYKAGGRGFGGSEYIFRYRESRAAFDKTATRFRIHPGFIETLGLKRFTVGEEES